MAKYVIGLDYGTLSGRAAVVRCEDGKTVASSVKEYTHGVISRTLPDGTVLPAGDWALEVPGDYREVLETIVPDAVKKAGIAKDDIIGIGIDFTSCTVLPVDESGKPLCEKEGFQSNPHAYVKLWKHHGAQKQADRINALYKREAQKQGQEAEVISSETMLPKILQIAEEAPEVYHAADQILEAGDWMTQCLTGERKRSADMAGYKTAWSPDGGYGFRPYLKELHPLLENLIEEKLGNEFTMDGEPCGRLTPEWGEKLGLPAGIAVAAALIDAHAGIPGSGVTEQGQMMLVLGTSSVMLAPVDNALSKEGVVSGARGGVLPEKYCLESGIAAVGDMLGWFIENMVPGAYLAEAKKQQKNIHTYLSEKAAALLPGQSGLVALDWWNGNKTPYVDGRLSGVLVGSTLETKPEEIYRALIEATAFGTRMIMELYNSAGAGIRTVIASGGIVGKNPFMMQVYADVLNCEIRLSDTDQTAALGSAVYAAVAAGKKAGGYDTLQEAVGSMSHLKAFSYHPDPENAKRYRELYGIYKELVGLFDPRKISAMERLKTLSGVKRSVCDN